MVEERTFCCHAEECVKEDCHLKLCCQQWRIPNAAEPRALTVVCLNKYINLGILFYFSVFLKICKKPAKNNRYWFQNWRWVYLFFQNTRNVFLKIRNIWSKLLHFKHQCLSHITDAASLKFWLFLSHLIFGFNEIGIYQFYSKICSWFRNTWNMITCKSMSF